MELKEALRVQVYAEVPLPLEIGRCIINYAGRQAAHKSNEHTRVFGIESPQRTFYSHVLKVYINFQGKQINCQKHYQTDRHYLFNIDSRNT